MDITITGIPDEIPEKTVKEWVSVLMERFYNKKINEIPEVLAATAMAKSNIESFKVSNNISMERIKDN